MEQQDQYKFFYYILSMGMPMLMHVLLDLHPLNSKPFLNHLFYKENK